MHRHPMPRGGVITTPTPSGRRSRRRGLAAVELALLLPILCFLFVATIDFARVFYFDLIVANCARNGALHGSRDPTSALDTSGIQTAAQRDAGNLNVNQMTVASSTNSSTNPTTVTVTVTYPFHTLTSYPGISSSLTLTRTVQMSVSPWTPSSN